MINRNQEHIELLGLKAEDVVTGFKGVITSVAFDLYGCVQAILTPAVSKDGKRLDGSWYDVTRLKLGKGKPIMALPDFTQGYVADGKKGAAEKPAK